MPKIWRKLLMNKSKSLFEIETRTDYLKLLKEKDEPFLAVE